MQMPIIFVHSGWAEHLYIATRQARLSNPDAEIVLIGDRDNRLMKWPTSHHLVDDYAVGVDRFRSNYVHRSPNPPSFETFCFERWFVVAQWMQTHDVDRAWVCDSDLMIYSNLSEVANRFTSFDLGISYISGHSLMINRRQTVNELCDYINRMFEDADQRQFFDDLFHHSPNELDRSISDMTAITHFSRSIPDRIVDLATIRDGSVLDYHIRQMDGFEGDHCKRVRWRDGKPFGYHRDHADPIQFHTLHFQGRAKQMIHRYATNPDIDVWTSWLKRRTTTRLARLKRHLPKRRPSSIQAA
ncbi:hypothetical protein Poly51_16330 [Rubripirellula tenax]|uniref:Nucleotide-diphospho-sugar transferase n=1 Tax=Rubripirellula tenax TaxID=2528015 RepID=A0A5C6FAN1_9BACT|nr:hypothetical protein [Rubripirellula tenax]TWU58853.1 hypothetical protein Poly51_16330 [Rubripirellula tenax]